MDRTSTIAVMAAILTTRKDYYNDDGVAQEAAALYDAVCTITRPLEGKVVAVDFGEGPEVARIE